jgi:hypothetical protein
MFGSDENRAETHPKVPALRVYPAMKAFHSRSTTQF